MSQYYIPLKAIESIYHVGSINKFKYYFWGITFLVILIMFLPWTQNIRSKGNVTTIEQGQRPQKINSLIPGRIEKWLVKEGDFVKKGDTILILSEIKEEYLDPNLINQSKAQLNAKSNSIKFYNQKNNATESQINNLLNAQQLKIKQLENKNVQLRRKLAGENAELKAIMNEYNLLKNQYDRQLKMYEEGLVSQTQLQQRSIQYQNANAKLTMIENKIAQTQQEILNNGIEQSSATQEYAEKVNKAQSDKFQNLTQIANSQGEVAKIENQINSYIIRNSRYIVTATQDGQVIQANKSGIGEILKEGESIAVIVPDQKDYAVEIFVSPMDLPLINVGQHVRFTFDGFPAIVFSGWPKHSYGAFAGTIMSYENAIGDNGKYRLIIKEDAAFKKWPQELRIGSGAQAILLLKDVPIWYELWRNVNGFPPDFYEHEVNEVKKSKEK
jgi:multidrug efflux pump subunit AcrA (membrane-fusion protein)